jgi:hypothetical protein
MSQVQISTIGEIQGKEHDWFEEITEIQYSRKAEFLGGLEGYS